MLKILVIGNNSFAKAISETIKTYGKQISLKEHYNHFKALPPIIEDISGIIPKKTFDNVDLILCIVKSPALRSEIVEYALKKQIPIIIGTEHVNLRKKKLWFEKTSKEKFIQPEVLCQLEQDEKYCNEFNIFIEEFGRPEFKIDGTKKIEIVKGAPCGSTWKTVAQLEKNTADDLVQEIGLKTQYNCFATRGITATGSTGKIYIAAKIHAAALKKSFSQK
ncbi:MAG: DUF166 family protein [Candidatus Hodarchaeota archaeon]